MCQPTIFGNSRLWKKNLLWCRHLRWSGVSSSRATTFQPHNFQVLNNNRIVVWLFMPRNHRSGDTTVVNMRTVLMSNLQCFMAMRCNKIYFIVTGQGLTRRYSPLPNRRGGGRLQFFDFFSTKSRLLSNPPFTYFWKIWGKFWNILANFWTFWMDFSSITN